MKKISLLILFGITLVLNAVSQIYFEEGYYINEQDERIECLIKNIDWRNNPTSFTYKLETNSSKQEAKISSVKEFGIIDHSKFIRSSVSIDRSSSIVSQLSDDKNPEFKEEVLFLKTLIEGEASLYSYLDGNIEKYFYKIGDNKVEQLVFKLYKVTPNKIGRNERFRQQLFANLICSKISKKDFQSINYEKRSLVKVFRKYNECSRSEYTDYIAKRKTNKFNISLRPRMNYSSLRAQNLTSGKTDFGGKLNYGLGIEVEFLLPFNKDKWAITVEPTYQSYIVMMIEESIGQSGGKKISNAKYKSIDLPVSLRHYFFLSRQSKVFIDVSVIPNFSFDSSIYFSREDGTILSSIDLITQINFAFGAGFKLKNRFSIQIRYHSSREVLSNYLFHP